MITVNRWTKRGHKDTVVMEDGKEVYFHDTVSIVRRKIAIQMKCDPKDVWAWVSRRCVSPQSSPTFSRQLSKRILLPFSVISFSEAKRKLQYLFGNHVADLFHSDTDQVTLPILMRFFKKVNVQEIVEPLLHYWVYDVSDGNAERMVRSCNPFDESALEPDPLVTNGIVRSFPNLGKTMQTMCKGARELHFVLRQDVLNYALTRSEFSEDVLSTYFPNGNDEQNGNDDTSEAYVNYDSSLQHMMQNTSSTIDVNGFRISYAHFKTDPNVHPPQHVSLFDVFSEFEVDTAIPVLTYRNDYDTKYKIHKPSLNDLIDDDHLIKWMQRKGQQNIGYVIFYVRISSRPVPIFATLVLYTTLRYDIIITFSKSSYMGSQSDVSNAVQRVLPVLKFIEKKLPVGSVLPEFNRKNMWTVSPEGSHTHLSSMNVYMSVTDSSKKLPTSKAFRETLSKFFKTEFSMLRTKDAVTLQYRKVDNFVHLTDIQHFLVDRVHLNRSLMIQHVMKEFHIGQEEASEEVHEWLNKRKELTESQFVSIKTTMSASLSRATTRVHGINSLEGLRRCMQAYVFALHAARSSRLQNQIRKLHDSHRSIVSVSSFQSPTRTLTPVESVAFVDLLSKDFSEEEPQSIADVLNMEDDEGERYDEEEDEEVQKNSKDSRAQVEELSKVDPMLFAFKKKGYSSFATICGKVDERQPVVLNKEQQDKYNPHGYRGDVVMYGSDPEHMQYYACPDVWCPKSKLAMTYEQYNAAGKKCPKGSEEEAILFENKYWEGRKKRRYIGFLDPSKHPKGLCMPCCFKTPQKNISKCRGNSEEEPTNKQQKYVKNESGVLEPGRLGLLPEAIASFIGEPQTCGTRIDGSGPITERSDCTLRIGIRRNDSPFMSAVSAFINSTVEQMSVKIIQSIDVKSFVTLQNGSAYRSFCQNADYYKQHISEKTEFKRFQRYVEKFPDQFDDATIKACRKHEEFSYQKMGIRTAGSVFRSFCVHSAMLEYFEAISKGSLGHNLMTDAVQLAFGIDILTFDPTAQELMVFRPSCTEVRSFYALLYHSDGHYEPIGTVHVDKKTALVKIDYEFKSEDEKLTRLIKVLRSINQETDLVIRLVSGLRESLSKIDMETTDILVCNGGKNEMSACGLRVISKKHPSKAPLLIPFPNRLPIVHCLGSGWVHLDEAFFEARGTSWTPAEIKRVLQHLRIDTGDDAFAPETNVHDDSGNVIAIMMKDRDTAFPIPCDYPGLAEHPYGERFFDHNRDVMVDSPPTDPDIVRAHIKLEMESMFDAYALVIFKSLEDDESLMQELRFITSDYNPFPLSIKREKAHLLLKRALHQNKELVVDIPDKFSKDFVHRLTIALFEGVALSNKFESTVFPRSRDEIIMDSNHIGKLKKLGAFTRGGILAFVENH